ncbi:putative lipoprotein [Corallococcus coralloides]|uniref:Putative lipoprotein n=1 Tax=Corallococcus coralloides TaxID=184914 RepID=A0A410RZI9_CORCK|nr:putative lipoprotein [Corallococcus coralloides]
MLRPRLAALALLPLVSACSNPECTDTADCASRGPDIVCVEERCVQASSPDAGAGDSGVDASTPDAGTEDAGAGDAGSLDGGGSTPEASLRITEINPDAPQDLIELVAVTGGTLTGISLQELTNSDFAFTFPQGFTVETGAVLVLHLGGSCTDAPGDPASCGQTAPFSASAWDFSMPGTLSYSGKVLELLSSKSVPVDGVPFVRASGEMPLSIVAAIQRLQADRVWDATPCIHDMTTGFAKDRYCRNIAADWSGLNESSSIMRISGTTPLTTPGLKTQWSGPLPSRWGSY